MLNLETKVDIDITLYCNDCGEELSGEAKEDKWGSPTIDVEPCANCLLAEFEKGIGEGEKNAA